VVDKKHYKF